MERAMSMMSPAINVMRLRRPPQWSDLRALMIEWSQRARSRRELMMFSEHDLSDAGITRTDAFQETSKPFWQN
jgi:uncharacterized protein YjiS (DUF1127 family)